MSALHVLFFIGGSLCAAYFIALFGETKDSESRMIAAQSATQSWMNAGYQGIRQTIVLFSQCRCRFFAGITLVRS